MLLLAVGQAGAITTNYWTGAAGDNLWTSAGNWSLGALPDSSQAVAIENSGTNSVILDSPEWIWGLSLGGSATLSISGATLQCGGFTEIETNAVLNLDGGLVVGGPFQVSGTAFQIDGTLNWAGGALNASASGLVGPDGNLNIGPGSNFLSGSLCNYGAALGTVTWSRPLPTW